MISEISEELGLILIYSAIPGGFGGLAAFLMALKLGHYKNNKYISKFLIEIVGSMVTASFITIMITTENYKVAAAFAVGVAWARILQMIRTKITKIVEAALGNIERNRR